MPRYLIEVAYDGTNYSGFQVQKNAITIQSEVEKAMLVYFRRSFSLTGSSRTDAGVHAFQNFFHADSDNELTDFQNSVYSINCLLPHDITVKDIRRVKDDFHCRFDATERYYVYKIYFKKDPFLLNRAYYYPYPLDILKLNEAASLITSTKNFKSFSKRKTQVKTFNCSITESKWLLEGDLLEYHVSANRFLRGMVKGLVATMLLVGTGKIGYNQFLSIIRSEDCANADFSAPPHALYLKSVVFDEQ